MSPTSDIAALWLGVADGGEGDPQRVWSSMRIDFEPPAIGSRVVAFGYPNSKMIFHLHPLWCHSKAYGMRPRVALAAAERKSRGGRRNAL